MNAFASSVLPQFARRDVEAIPGVATAHPLTGLPVIYAEGKRRTPIFLMVYDTAGGPNTLVAGQVPTAPREMVIDRSLAKKYDLAVSDPLIVSDLEFKIADIVDGAAALFAMIDMTANLVCAPQHLVGIAELVVEQRLPDQ